jgi:hypothetical protein
MIGLKDAIADKINKHSGSIRRTWQGVPGRYIENQWRTTPRHANQVYAGEDDNTGHTELVVQRWKVHRR